jgi:uncharacterized membrane-anchored protein YjiN (DUF445 family)
MNRDRFFVYFILAVFLVGGVIGCHHRTDPMSAAEKVFVKKIDKAAGKLGLSEDQKAKLEGLKAEVRKNFEEGRKENREAWMKIKEEAAKENPDIQKMTPLFQGILRDDAQRLNTAFDMLIGFQSNLNDVQKEKLAKMISEKVKKWD